MSLKIINYPTSVVTHLAPHTGIYDEQQAKDRKTRLRALASPVNRVMCHHLDASVCEIFPDWMVESGPGLIRHTRIREKLRQSPFLSVQMLLSAYDETQPMLEPTVLSSAEAVVPLLEAIEAGKIKPANSRSTYEQPLLNAPWWGLRYLASTVSSSGNTEVRAKFASDLRKRCEERQSVDPQSALVHYLFNQSLDPSKGAEMMAKDAMTAYLATRLLGVRGLNLHIEQITSLDPRWATHIALWGAFSGGNVDDRVEQAICQHAAWAGEYITRNEMRQRDWGWASGVYSKVEAGYQARASSNPDLWADLLWALLDRRCLEIEGKDPRITFAESFERQKKQFVKATSTVDSPQT